MPFVFFFLCLNLNMFVRVFLVVLRYLLPGVLSLKAWAICGRLCRDLGCVLEMPDFLSRRTWLAKNVLTLAPSLRPRVFSVHQCLLAQSYYLTAHENDFTNLRVLCVTVDDPIIDMKQCCFPKSVETLVVKAISDVCMWRDPFMLPPGLKDITLRGVFAASRVAWPKTLQCVRISSSLMLPLLPDFLKKLVCFYYMANHLLPAELLPASLETLTLGRHFNNELPILPSKLRKLFLGAKFNQVLRHPLPDTLQILSFGIHFNQMLPLLPNGLKSLTMGYKFNQELSAPLPSSLVQLILKGDFNQILPDNLPDQLEILSLGRFFNQKLPKLPRTLQHLQLGSQFNQPISGCISPNLITLSFGGKFNHPLSAATLTSKLQGLWLGKDFASPIERLPASLQVLRVGHADGLHPKILVPKHTRRLSHHRRHWNDNFGNMHSRKKIKRYK